jgi:LAO/AO transport system kinase
VVIVESVGIGQSEVAIDETTDMLMLLVPPAGGDELQGIKKGIMELVDLVVVNKADGKLEDVARHSVVEHKRALQLQRPRSDWWKAKVTSCSALHNHNIDKVWEIIGEYKSAAISHDGIKAKRRLQGKIAMWRRLQSSLRDLASSTTEVNELGQQLEEEIFEGEVSTRRAANQLFSKLCGFIISNEGDIVKMNRANANRK